MRKPLQIKGTVFRTAEDGLTFFSPKIEMRLPCPCPQHVYTRHSEAIPILHPSRFFFLKARLLPYGQAN
jgi:hypothetical protein